MKKFIAALCATLLLASCRTGTYSVSSGKADEAMISFLWDEAEHIQVTVDGKDTYELSTVKTQDWRKNPKIKKTAKNTIYVKPGKHTVVVSMKEREKSGYYNYSTYMDSKYEHKVFLSAQEHKMIDLHINKK